MAYIMHRCARLLSALLGLWLLHPLSAVAAPYYGLTLSTILIPKELPYLRGVQLMFNYDPQCFKWRKFNLYFDGGYSHLWVTNPSPNNNINIYSLAPVVRYTFRQRAIFHPFFELSFGIAYLNQTRLGDRNLGIHFSFQDRLGFGVYVGEMQQFSLGVHVVHYSNAHFSSHNSGITAPLVLDLGYRFSA